MRLIQWFIKQMKSEPKKKSFKWTISENKILSITDVDRLRNACLELKEEGIRHQKFFLIRDWFMIELGLFTGLRVDEMRQLKVGDVLIDGRQSSVVVQNGKGGRKRSVWINAEFKRICKEFFILRERSGLSNDPDCFVLSSDEGEPLTKRALQKAFKRCLKEAGLSEQYSIHCLRHTYGTFLLKAGQNIKLVKEQLGHSSVNTTETYISLINEDTKAALAKLYKVKKRESKPTRKGIIENDIIPASALSVEELIQRACKIMVETPEERWKEIIEFCEENIPKDDFIE